MNKQEQNLDKLHKIGNEAYEWLYGRLNKGAKHTELIMTQKYLTYLIRFNKEAKKIGSDWTFDGYLA